MPVTLVDGVRDVTREFFSRPLEEKALIALEKSPHFRWDLQPLWNLGELQTYRAVLCMVISAQKPGRLRLLCIFCWVGTLRRQWAVLCVAGVTSA